MKYRIKITTYKNGRKTYEAQFKTILGWAHIDTEGKIDIILNGAYHISRVYALDCIDKHFNGNTKKQTIEFEYINK